MPSRPSREVFFHAMMLEPDGSEDEGQPAAPLSLSPSVRSLGVPP